MKNIQTYLQSGRADHKFGMRISEADKVLLESLSKKHNVSQSEVVRAALNMLRDINHNQ